ncbi:hypothetical protein H5410_005334, partial [Solanum commersonii]
TIGVWKEFRQKGAGGERVLPPRREERELPREMCQRTFLCLLGRCLVGYLEKASKEKPSLSEIRRWSFYEWKKAFGVNIYELYGDMFLFEFPNKFMAEQTLQGQWKWRNQSFNLEWWSPVVGCMPISVEVNKTWIKIIGIPLHLWSQQVFEEIGQLCGGWVATEEETKLKNHMKWKRILVANSGRNIPKEVSILRGKIRYHFPIWVEGKARYEILAEKVLNLAGEEDNNLKSGDPSTDNHVGNGKLIAVVVPTESCENHVTSLMKESIMGLRSRPEQLNEEYNGPDPASLFIFNSISNSTQPNPDWILQDKETQFCQKTMQVAHQNTEKEITTADSSGILGDVVVLNMGESEAQVPFGEVMIGREDKEVRNSEDQRTLTSDEEWEVKEAEPLYMQQQLLITEKEKEVSAWVKQNVIKLGKLLGADFQGHEKEAMELLLQVDSARQARHQEAVAVSKKKRFKGSNELKSLVAFDVKFKSGGGTRGGIMMLWDSRIWKGEVLEIGTYTLTYKFESQVQDFSCHITGDNQLNKLPSISQDHLRSSAFILEDISDHSREGTRPLFIERMGKQYVPPSRLQEALSQSSKESGK